MSKKEIVNKEVKVSGLRGTPMGKREKTLNVIITNNRHGKTLSIDDGLFQFTIPFEPIEKYLK